MLVKILMTVSSLMGIGLIWFSIKNTLLKKIYNAIKDILADGKITKDEVVDKIKELLGV